MKILCVCTGGNARSGTLANILRRLGHDALNASARDNSLETLRALCAWADRIFSLSDEAQRQVVRADANAIQLNVGEDLWGQTMAPPLVARCLEVLLQYHQAQLTMMVRIPSAYRPEQADSPDTSDQGW
jgi:hypothetical protein